jgi:hypothetical protein
VEANAWDFEKGEIKKVPCPCKALEEGDCKAVGCLQFLLPEVDEAAATYQINTSSKNSIIDVNSGIKFIRAIAGRIAMIPIILKREAIDIHRVENKELKTGRHYTMKLSLEGISLQKLQLMGKAKPTEILLPAPDESQPEDLFPANGFSPEEEEKKKANEEKKKAKEKEAFEKAELQKLKQELEYSVKEYLKTGSELNEAFNKRLKELTKKEEFQKAIEFFTARLERIRKDAEEEAKLLEGGASGK